ncbi:legumain-like isoform X2 [Neocloeon triangulifer]|nr:legumain-like isoform X2 [Neocloeon triangulifer]
MWRPVGLVALFSICVVAEALNSQSLPRNGKKWALLVAGSKEFYNYRHQADLCHAYQILRGNGIPNENIIVMMFDDIANSKENPTQGVIINEPGGFNVYENVPKDYTGEAVNSSTFLAVLRGDKDAVNGIGSGRVLETGPHDHIFVNFVDHGAPGLLAMPSDVLYASQLLTTLQEMSVQNKFAKMVLYVEACESGSMFDALLPDDTNIFVITAADPHESSYACYFDNLRNTYLGDVFSVMWMQDTEQEDLGRETLHHQFEVVRSRTNTSHVEEYGDLNVGASLLKDFIGSTPVSSYRRAIKAPLKDVVSSRDVPIEIVKRKMRAELNATRKHELRQKLHRMTKHRKVMVSQFRSIIEAVVRSKDKVESIINTRKQLRNLKCYERLVQSYDRYCFNIAENSHSLSQLYMFVNVCEMRLPVEEFVHAIKITCRNNSQSGFFTDTVV